MLSLFNLKLNFPDFNKLATTLSLLFESFSKSLNFSSDKSTYFSSNRQIFYEFLLLSLAICRSIGYNKRYLLNFWVIANVRINQKSHQRILYQAAEQQTDRSDHDPGYHRRLRDLAQHLLLSLHRYAVAGRGDRHGSR